MLETIRARIRPSTHTASRRPSLIERASGRGTDLTIRLRDGRMLGYAEYGDRSGTPVMYFHGSPGSRLEGQLLDEAAVRARVRLIAVDRPGYGLSDFQSKRRFIDWPDDVAQLARWLRLDRYAVLGLSGGGPHAAACALRLAASLTSATIVSGAGPPEAALVGKGWLRRAVFHLAARVLPATTRISLWFVEQGLRRLPSSLMLRFPDPQVLKRPRIRELFRRDLLEAFRHGVRGPAHEYRLFAKKWELPLEEIMLPVHLWHGEADRVVPVEIGRYMAGAIPNARATYVPNAGHLMIVDIADQVFAKLGLGQPG